MSEKYIVVHHFSYGWDIMNEDEPTFYDTVEEAQEHIDLTIAMTKEAFKKGDMDEAYDPMDFRVGIVEDIDEYLLTISSIKDEADETHN